MKTLTLDGKKYQFGPGVTEDQIRAFHKKNQQIQQISSPENTVDVEPKGFAEQLAYGLKRKYRESGAGIKQFLTGKESNLPVSANLPSDTSEVIGRAAGSLGGRLSELAAESIAGSKVGQKLGGPRGALIGAVAGPFIGGYLKQPGERVSLERLISGGAEAASSAGYKLGKGIIDIYKAGGAVKELKPKLLGKEKEALEAAKKYQEAYEETPAQYQDTSRILARRIASGEKKLIELEPKKTELESNIEKSKNLIPKIKEQLKNYPEKKFQVEQPSKPGVPQLSSMEKLARQEETFTSNANKIFDPKIDYEKAAAEEHNKIYNDVSKKVNKKYNDVLKGVKTKEILAGQKGYNIYETVAKSLGAEKKPLRNLIPDKILNSEEQDLITGLENYEKLKSIPTEKVLSFYKTAKQTARKFNNKAWQEANNLTDTERNNLEDASKQFTSLAEKLGEVLNEIDPKIIPKLKKADAYFAENKAPFYARPEHWQAQKQGRITSDILETTHADIKTAPEAAFLRKLIMQNENYRRAALGKVFSNDYKKLLTEGDFEKYSEFVQNDPAVKLIHENLKNFNRLKTAQQRLTNIEKPIKTEFGKAAQDFKQNIARMKTQQDKLKNQLEGLLKKQQEGQTASEKQLRDVVNKINQIKNDLNDLQKYLDKLQPLEKRKDLTETEIKEIKLKIKEVRLEYARKKATLLGIDKLASKLAGFTILKKLIL